MKRRSDDVSDVPTRPTTRAVKRRAPRLDEVLAGVDKVNVLRRTSLRNAADGEESGWVVQGDQDKDLFSFVPSAEPLLDALKRVVGRNTDLYLDVMLGGSGAACLLLHAHETPTQGEGELLDAEAEELAGFLVGKNLWANCLVGGNPEPVVSLRPVLNTVHAKAGDRLVATVLAVIAGDLLPRLHRRELSFHNEASAFERLLVVTAVVLADAWEVREVENAARRDPDRWNIDYTFGGPDDD